MVQRGRKNYTWDEEKWRRVWPFTMIIGLVSVFVVGSAAAQGMTPTAQTIEGLRLPLQRHENGRVQSMLLADRAWMTDVGVSGEGNIRVYLMSEDGTTNGVAGAERGDFNQKDMTADCYGRVYLEKGGVKLSGTNLYWDAKSTVVRIETNAVLVLDRGGKSAVEGIR